VLYCACQLPRVEIKEVDVEPVTEDLYWLKVTVVNDRVYPTSSDRAVQLKRAVMDKITFRHSRNIQPLEMSGGTAGLDFRNPKARFTIIPAKGAEFRLKGKDTKRFCTLV